MTAPIPATFSPIVAHPSKPVRQEIPPWLAAAPPITKYCMVEKHRYLDVYSCTLHQTTIDYNCGAYDHPELDPTQWYDIEIELLLLYQLKPAISG